MIDSLIWIIPLIVGAVLWAGADVISDGVIAETNHKPQTSPTTSRRSSKDNIALKNHQPYRRDSSTLLDDDHHDLDGDILLSSINSSSSSTLSSSSSIDIDYKKSDDVVITPTNITDDEGASLVTGINTLGGGGTLDVKLTGDQDALISGIVMFFCGLFLHAFYGSSTIFSFLGNTSDTILDDGMAMIDGRVVLYVSLISGVFQCFSLIYLLRAFESSSSTVIVPLMQLNALFVLPMSIVLSFLSTAFPVLSTFNRIITPIHLIAFLLIFIGGFYPSVEGEWSQFRNSFWRQIAVQQVLLSDFLIAVYYMIVSFCTNETGGMTSMSFLVISIYGNALTFLFLIVFIRRYRKSFRDLFYIRRKYVLLSAFGEILSISGYFFVSISYHLYYNSGIVSATEGALNQLFNLLVAILLKKFINFGREVKRIKEKLYSCIIVTIGLILTST